MCEMTIKSWKMCKCSRSLAAATIIAYFISLKLITAFNYDYASSCTRPYRSARMNNLLAGIPCDFNKQNYCNLPGSAYPWHAVRRFVHENQGLMRRMYGEQRHISVLKTEMDDNEIEDEMKELGNYKMKLSDEAIIKTKQFYAKKPTAKAVDLKTVPHFRPTHTTPKSVKLATSEEKLKNKIDEVKEIVKKIESINKNHSESGREPAATAAAAVETASAQNESDNIEKVASYKTTFLQEELQEEKVEYKDNANLHQNKIEPDIITLVSLLGETNQTLDTTTTTDDRDVNTSDAAVTSTTAPNAKPNEDAKTVEDLTTENSDEAGWRPMTIDPSTLPPTSLFSEHDKHKQTDIPTETSTSSASQSATTSTQSDPNQDSSRPVMKLKGVNACPAKEEVVAPFWANNTRGEVLALLNLYPFEQYVHWEKCSHEHKQMYCRDGCRCEQQYRLHRLLAYDPNNECRGIFSDWFRFPSCCVCKCYDVPMEYRVTSRSPRILEPEYDEEVKQAIYEDAASDWYTIDMD